MSSSLLLPNPCLLGIVFTIATHDGNQLVFHYPPKPNEYGFQATPLDMNELSHNVEGLNDSSEDEIYDDDDDDDDVRYNDENDDYGIDDEDDDDDNEDDDTEDESEFNDSDLDSVGAKSNRTLSTDSLASDQNRHKRSSSSSNNRYQSGRDLLELMYEREQKKKEEENFKKETTNEKTQERKIKSLFRFAIGNFFTEDINQ